MQPDSITEATVREALKAMRSARSLNGSPLLGLDALSAMLRRQNLHDTPKARVTVLQRHLQDASQQALAALRPEVDGIEPTSVEQALIDLRSDFAAQSAVREAWSLLHFRYFSGSAMTLLQLADDLHLSYKTVRRRLEHGHRLLAGVLRDIETTTNTAQEGGHGIPRPATRFIGRERELADIRALLAEHLLIVLTGPGGVGKSRLAIEIAGSLAPDYGDGAWFVELASQTDRRYVPRAVAEVLGVREHARARLPETIAEHIADKRMLLVLDNCEHVAEACVDLVEHMMQRCPRLQLLVTSRVNLHIDGQALWPTPPMQLPPDPAADHPLNLMHSDAVRLLASRVTLVKSSFQPTEEDGARFARICRQLDGIPLAIELAAAQSRSLTLGQLETRLKDRFALLRGGHRAQRPGHEALRATLDWSYGLLGDQEQELLARLSVFRGGWSAAAAKYVAAGEGLPLEVIPEMLARLHAHSLIEVREVGNHVRYSILETIRQYAAEKIAEGGHERTWRSRHTDYFLEWAEIAGGELKRPSAEVKLEQIAEDYPNVRTALRDAYSSTLMPKALRAAAALATWWERSGLLEEGRELLDALLAVETGPELGVARASVLRASAELARRQGAMEEARRRVEEAIQTSAGADDALGLAHGQSLLALLESIDGRREVAQALYEETIAAYERLGERRELASEYVNLGILFGRHGEYADARRSLETGLEMKRQDGGDFNSVIMALGVVAQYQSDYPTARTLFEEALEISRAKDDSYAISIALQNLSANAGSTGDWEQQRFYLEEALIVQRRVGEQPGLAAALLSLGQLESGLGNDRKARTRYEEALQIVEDTGVAEFGPLLYNNLGHLEIRKGNLKAARQLLIQALELAQSNGDKRSTAVIQSNLSLVTARSGDATAAAEHFAACVALNLEMEDWGAIALALENRARADHALGRAARSLRLIGAAASLREQIGARDFPSDAAELRAIQDQASAEVGASRASVLLLEGRDLAREDAVKHALGDRPIEERL